MKRLFPAIQTGIALVLLVVIALPALSQNGTGSFNFIENKGQWNSNVTFAARFNAGAFYLQKNGYRVLMHDTAELARMVHRHISPAPDTSASSSQRVVADMQEADHHDQSHTSADAKDILHSHVYNVSFEGSADNPEIVPEKPLDTYNNYFLGNDPSKWTSHARLFQAVTYKNIYPNVDVRYYSENGYLKYDLIVHPGGDPNQITMLFDGAEKLSVNKNQQLAIKTSVGEVKELFPYTFQFDSKTGKKEVECHYKVLSKNKVKFEIKDYSPDATLIIDPTIVFCVFTGSAADNWGFTATPGPDGSFFAGGIAHGAGYPTSTGAIQSSFAGGDWDMGITRFNASGSAELYSTYLGGSANEYPHSLFSDPQGNLVIMGRTYSNNFPGTLIGSRGGASIVVTKINSTGTSIIGSLIIGGSGDDGVNMKDLQQGATEGPVGTLRNYGDDSRSEVILDANNYIYVAAQTKSSNFPVTSGSFQQTYGGNQDGVVLKINPDCTALEWASYLGGSGDDGAFVMALNPNDNNIYVGGATTSSDFPGDKSGVIQSTNAGDLDGFATIISNDGKNQLKTTYLGTSDVDVVYGLKFDKSGYPYVMGITRGIWQVTTNVTFKVANSSQFLSKLKPDLSAFEYSTVFGDGKRQPNISPVAFLVDRCENVYISGWGGWPYLSGPDPYNMATTQGLPVTSDAFKPTSDGKDFYFIVIKRDAASLLFATFFGQGAGFGEHVDGGTSRYDEQGVIYQAICANCGSGYNSQQYIQYPTTGENPALLQNYSPSCNLAALKIAFNFAGVAAGPKAYFNGLADSVGCVPFTVLFKDTLQKGKTYQWNFGDGSPDTTTSVYDISHTYTQVGYYTVRLIAIDSASCNLEDTAYVHIRVRDDPADLAIDYQKLPPCESLKYRFTNNSIPPATKPFSNNSFVWDFGDGTQISAGVGDVEHTFASAGTYNVQLILVDTNYCNAPESITLSLRVSPIVEASFVTPLMGCAPYEAYFNNTSLGGRDFVWDFGDGTTSTEVDPMHLYNDVGTYTITLTATDEETCNKVDDTTVTINVYPKPTAAFNTTPVPPQVNTPTVFYNLSGGGVRYKWLFGDGDSTITTTTDTVMHQYNMTANYNACLITFNEYNCSDTACNTVSAEITPLLDVPNAFTPGRFGQNSRIQVTGFGIARMTWKIYNRWGQIVFQSNNRKESWDGTYKGQLQPMDVYAYTLEVEFVDGTRTTKRGDITLIR